MWSTFELFREWMESQPYHRKRLTKLDMTAPHGPGNSVFESSIRPKYDQALDAIAAATGQTPEEVMAWGSTVKPARVYQRAAELLSESTDS
jgi:hypothetical protein